jgi:hypothetical protein
MALIVKDRVREITSTTGTGTITLTAAVVGFQSFSVIGDGNQTYYTIVDAATGAFEVGIGTYTASGTTLSRDTVLESSNANALVSFSSGTKDVFVTYPADRSVSQADIGTEPNEIPLNQYLGQAENRQFVTAYTPTTTQPIRNYIPVLQTAASGVARFDHNPVTTESLGLLIEEQRTNLLTYSEDFTDGSWVKSNTTITSNTITAPDGTLTGDKLVETSGAGVRQLYKTPSLSAVSHSFSAYFKASERYWFKLNLTGSGAYFDLSTGVIGTIDAGVTAAMTAVGNGWYRCSIVRTVSAGTNYTEIQLALTNGGGSYTGDGYSGIFIWGAQLEAGAFPTSYIPTVASQVTRSADSASMTGTNFSDWYRPDEGTLYGEYVSGESQGTQAVAYIGDNTVNNRIVVYDDGTVGVGSDGYIIVASSGVTQALINLGTSSRNQKHKIIGAYKTNDFAGSFDGGSSSVDTLGIVPLGLDRLILADAGGVASSLNGHLRKFAYYPARLSNAELQEMTEQ